MRSIDAPLRIASVHLEHHLRVLQMVVDKHSVPIASSIPSNMHSEICDNSMQTTVLDDAMKDDAFNDRVAGSVASLDKRKWNYSSCTRHL